MPLQDSRINFSIYFDEGKMYAIKIGDCTKHLITALNPNIYLIVQYLGENKFIELLSSQEVTIDDIFAIEELTDDIKLQYSVDVLNNSVRKNQIIDTFKNPILDTYILYPYTARLLAETEDAIYNANKKLQKK